MLKTDFTCCPTEAEWLDGLKRAGLRRAGKGRLIVQTVALAIAAVMSLISFFYDGMKEAMSAVIAAVALGLIPVMWFVPQWRMRSTARKAADDHMAAHVWLFEDGLDVSDHEPEKAYFRFADIHVSLPTDDTLDTIVLRFKTDDVVVIPHRALSDEQWAMLTDVVGKSNA